MILRTTTREPCHTSLFGRFWLRLKKEDVVEDGTNLPSIENTSASASLEGFDSIITVDNFNAAKDEFIKEKCKNGVLMYKDFPVKSEMAEHIYSEIKFNEKTKCNPCDRTCNYNIIEAKLETESKLISKTSNDLFDAFSKFFGLSEPFEPKETNGFLLNLPFKGTLL